MDDKLPAQPDDPVTPPSSPAPATRRWVWPAAAVGTVAVAALGVASGVGWIWNTEAGTRWALDQVPGLVVTDVQGSLGGPTLSMRRLKLHLSSGELAIESLQLRELDWQWHPHLGAWAALRAGHLSAATVRWTSTPSTTPSSAPQNLQLPLDVDVAQWQLGQLQIDDLPALSQGSGSLTLGAEQGGEHRVSLQSLRSERFDLQGRLRIGTQAPLTVALDAQASSLPDQAPHWGAQLHAQGPLQALQLQARLQGSAQSGSPATQLDLQAEVHPFASWPVHSLALNTQALDLASLHAGWPRTRLSGSAALAQPQTKAPLQLSVDMSNTLAGRWDQGALPVQSLRLQADGHWSGAAALGGRIDAVVLRSVDVRLGGATTAGRLQGDGRWAVPAGAEPAAGAQAALKLQLTELQPAALDERLTPMRLSGPIQLTLDGLPQPAVVLGEADTHTAALRWQVQSQWQGLWANNPALPATALALDAKGSATTLEVKRFEARAAGALVQTSGQAGQSPDGGWHWQWQATLENVDPSVWWPGEPGSAWRRGPHRLTARLDTAGRLPAAAASQWTDPLSALRNAQGQVQLELAPSQLVGVALQGGMHLDSQRGEGLRGWVDAAGNRIDFSAQGTTAWRVDLKAPSLAALAPWASLSEATRAWSPQGGHVEAHGQLQPGDTAWQWQGQASGGALALGAWQLDQFDLQSQGSNHLDAPLSLALTAQGLRHGEMRVDQITLDVQGSGRHHQCRALIDSPVRPPLWFERLLGVRTGSGTRVQAQLDGAWQPESGQALWPAAGRWQGQLVKLSGGARDGSGQPWMAAQGIGLQADFGAQGQLLGLNAEPGRVQLPGTAVQWQSARWEPQHLDLDAQLEPFALAPLLDRAQPELGWRGDLIVGGELRVRRDERFDADIVIERRSGDLSVSEDVRNPTAHLRALGLSDLRLALNAHDGHWYFTHALAGRQLGEMAGVLSAQTDPALAWPDAHAAIDGVAQMRVANLDVWGAWVPPGWRLGGELRSTAQFSGHLDAPQITGAISGDGLTARHSLLGVELTDGRLALQLEGTRARLQTFDFRGGDGRLQMQGEAQLGEAPQAQLQVQADHFLMLGRVDRRVVASGHADLRLDRTAIAVDATVNVDEGLIDFSRGDAPGLDDDVSINQPDTLTAGDDSAPRSTRTVRLNTALNLGNQLRVKGHGLDTLLRGQLLLRHGGDRLNVVGALQTSGGTYAAYGQKLDIERGVITFTGPVEDPRLDIFAVRPNLDVQVGVAVTGTVLNPRVRLASEPEMSDAYKLSWLMLGREPDGLGEADTALLQRAALALLAGEGEAPTDALLKTFGITDFGVRQTTDSNDVRQTVVSLGKQLTRRWYVGYERSINATSGTWQLIYRAAQRFTLRAQSGEDNALDMIWSWRWP